MAGRYDTNPFDEEEVNPFAVSSNSLILLDFFFFKIFVRAFLLNLIPLICWHIHNWA